MPARTLIRRVQKKSQQSINQINVLKQQRRNIWNNCVMCGLPRVSCAVRLSIDSKKFPSLSIFRTGNRKSAITG